MGKRGHRRQPLVSLTIIVEGGGSGASNRRIECRKAFQSLFERVATMGSAPLVVAAGARSMAIERHKRTPGSVLLLDSEGPAERTESEAIYQMVQVMESWFLADTATTARILKTEQRKLSGNPKIEEVPKTDVFARLKACGYEKKNQSYRILGELDPAKIRKASPHADLLFKRIEQGR